MLELSLGKDSKRRLCVEESTGAAASARGQMSWSGTGKEIVLYFSRLPGPEPRAGYFYLAKPGLQ